MARLQGLTADEARRFRTGRPCLDLAHTGGDGPYAVFELLHEPGDVSRWLSVITGLDAIEAGETDVRDARALRRSVWNAAHDVIGGHPPACRTSRRSTGRPHAHRRSRCSRRPADPRWSGRSPRRRRCRRSPGMRWSCSPARWPAGSGSASRRTAACCTSISRVPAAGDGARCSAAGRAPRSGRTASAAATTSPDFGHSGIGGRTAFADRTTGR